MSGRISAVVAAMMGLHNFAGEKGSRPVYDPTEIIDVEKEYELIQKKESALSCQNRRRVVAAYHCGDAYIHLRTRNAKGEQQQ